MFTSQKLISDERFQSLVEGDVHRQLPVQFVNAVVSTPSMSDEIQVEIMKVCLPMTFVLITVQSRGHCCGNLVFKETVLSYFLLCQNVVSSLK